MLSVARYAGEVAGNTVELEFDQKLAVVNRIELVVDGAPVEKAKVVYGERELSTTLDDGTAVEVAVHSGTVGEATRVQLRQRSGSFVDLQPH